LRRNRWLLYLALAPLSLVLLVSACSDDHNDEPTATPTESVAAEATSTGSATSTVEATGAATSATTSTSTPDSTSTSAATASPTSSPGSGDNDYETEIEDFAFEQGITVAVGTTIRWENRDSVPHTVTADDGAFDSGLLATNETFEVVFDAAGSFAFHCNVHRSMTATVTVQ